MTTSRKIEKLVTAARTASVSEFETAVSSLDDDQLSDLADRLEEESLAEAAEAPRRLLTERSPEDETHWFNLGFNVYFHQRKHEAAEAIYVKAMKHCPGDGDLKVARAVNLVWGLHRGEEALALLSEALEQDPSNDWYRGVQAWSLLLSGNIEGGLVELRDLLNTEISADEDDDEHAAEEDDDSGLEPATVLEYNTYLYLFGEPDERTEALRTVARLLIEGVREPMGEFFDLVRIAEGRGHPEASMLKPLCEVVLEQKSLSTLLGRPAFRNAAIPQSYAELSALCTAVDQHLSHRAKVAFAVALADRGFEVLEEAAVAPGAVDEALEIARAFAEGDAVSEDEARWAHTALDDAEWEAAHELYNGERQMVQVIWWTINGVFSPENVVDSAASCLIDAVQNIIDDDLDSLEETAEVAALLLRIANTAETDLKALLETLHSEPVPRWVSRSLARLDSDEADLPEMEADAESLRRDRPQNAANRAARICALRETRTVPPWRAPNGIPRFLEVREAGRGPSSSEGKVAVSGHRHYGIFPKASDIPLFAPPESVALGMNASGRHLYSWRVSKRSGSGIARGHYDWILEVYTWPQKAEVGRHTVQARKTIEWFWPDHIVIRSLPNGDEIELRCNSEDDIAKIVLVREKNGEIRELSSEAAPELSDDEATAE